MSKKKCPACNKTDQVVKIIYGFPTEELFIKSEKGEMKLGGCCQVIDNDNPENNSPKWHCKRCDKDF